MTKRSYSDENQEDINININGTQPKKQHLTPDINVHVDSPPDEFDLELALSPPSSGNTSNKPPITTQALEVPALSHQNNANNSSDVIIQPIVSPPVALPPVPALAKPAPARRGRRKATPGNTDGSGGRARSNAKSPTITPPFSWATDKRATVHSLDYLQKSNIQTVAGEVQCKKCERTYTIEYNVQEKFHEIAQYVVQKKYELRHRAPEKWTNPDLPKCQNCGPDGICKPVISAKKKFINWLFLLLGQMLGCCTLEQLKYFCKHTKNHRTGAKDRVLFLAYLALCKQLDPTGPFNVSS